jgi:hypothetical protein
VFDLGIRFCGKKGNVNQGMANQNKKKERKEKPIYLAHGGTK